MSRPKPNVLLSVTDSKTFRTEQVLEAEAVFAVYFDQSPVNLRTVNTMLDEGIKYSKSSYSNPGHAFNLKTRLNSLFKTDKFTVVKLTAGTTIHEE